jgi:hypothetical protein
MRSHVRRNALTLVAGIVAALAAVPAHAATVTTRNACLYSFNNEYRDQLVTLTGSGSPAGAPAGATATLSGASISAQLPVTLPQTGYALGIFSPGYNAIPSRVWVAITASNAVPAVQVRELSVVASTTIVVDGSGEFVSGTPIVVTIPIPDTTWTVAADGPVAFSQAAGGTLPRLPVGVDDALVAVSGSIVVKPQLANLRFVLDCQPGSTAAPYTSFTAAAALPFATLDAAAPVPPVVVPAATAPRTAAPRLRILSPRSGVRGGRIALAVSCPRGTVACKGRVSVRSIVKVREGTRRRHVTMVTRRAYSVPAGRTRTLRLPLTRAGRHYTANVFRTMRVLAKLEPSSGRAVTRVLTLDR